LKPRALRLAVVLFAMGLPSASVTGALIFNFNVPDPSKAPSAQALAGFNAAAAIWSAAVTDSVTLNYDLYWEPLAAGVVGSAASEKIESSYSSVKTALTADTSSVDDTTAVANLSGGSFINVFINRTVNNPNGANSTTAYVDSSTTDIDLDGHANNNSLNFTRANAKALGLVAAADPGLDATIRFSSTFAFDFDRSDGINPAQLDFIGVSIHEIGHSLGFTSGVDILDLNGSGFFDDQFDFVSTLDLFRFSPESVAAGGLGTIDFSANNNTKSFSIDGGQNEVTGVTFSTGKTLGDGQQASHFKDNLGIGALDPTVSFGEQIDLTDNDKRVFDVIGWDLAVALSAVITNPLGGGGAAPEPVVLAPIAAMIILLYVTGRRRQPIVELDHPNQRCSNP